MGRQTASGFWEIYGRSNNQCPPLKPSLDPQSNNLQLQNPIPKPTQHAGRMGDTNYQAATSSRLGLKHGGGEIVEVEGGRIVRSTGRKDRHSKVCTAKGPRDRRVRLSAHTAIQFYDVQDRLGYDRPSKAVDWLIKKAKSAIDELAELPPWNPETLKTATSATKLSNNQEDRRRTTTIMGNEVQVLQEIGENPNRNSGFLPHSLVSDDIGDTLKSFIPSGVSSETPPSSSQFQNYPPDFSTGTGSHSQDQRLSFQSFPKPMLKLHHHQAAAAAQAHQSEPVLFSGINGGAGSGTGGGSSGGSGGFLFGNPSAPPLPPAFGQNSLQFISQRGPLQSSNTPMVRAWIDQPIPTTNQHHQIPQNIHHHQASFSGIGLTTSGVLSGFSVPARFQGEQEEHDSIPNKLFSASSDHHH